MQHICSGDAIAAKPARIGSIPDLEHTSSNILGMTGEKLLDIVAVNWQSPVVAIIEAHRHQTSEAAKAGPAHRRVVLIPIPFSPQPTVERESPCPPGYRH